MTMINDSNHFLSLVKFYTSLEYAVGLKLNNNALIIKILKDKTMVILSILFYLNSFQIKILKYRLHS